MQVHILSSTMIHIEYAYIIVRFLLLIIDVDSSFFS